MKNNPLPRLDKDVSLREKLLPHCRLKAGEVWIDPKGKHRIGCIDAANPDQVAALVANSRARLAIQDPPYNLVAFDEQPLKEYIEWCRQWVRLTIHCLDEDAALYIWLGADQDNGFQPLPDFMLMMREMEVKSRSFITMRN